MADSISIIIPARNESESLARVITQIRDGGIDAEIVVVDDGSSDDTAEIAAHHGAKLISHPYSLGNGAAIKSGARAASGAILVFIDADGQHDPADIPRLLARLEEGYDMAVGARQTGSQANLARGFGNRVYNRLASYMTGHRVPDLTSGLRAARAEKFREFLYLLPNGFSYPTTITMAFFRAGYSVAYVPIHAARRAGKSHLRLLRDGGRFLLIIFKVGTLYSPLKLFAPLALAHALAGLAYYAYTFVSEDRLSLATVFLLSTAITIFLIGLVSEQITQLMYRQAENSQ